MLVFLFGWCDPAGFWTWGVDYAFGPYAAVRHPLGLGLRYVFHQLLFAGSPLPFGMLVVGYVGLRVGRAATSPDRWIALLQALPWIVATTVAFLLQGKLFAYQALPIHWTLSMAGALWFGSALEARPRIPVRGALAASGLLALLSLRSPARAQDDEIVATKLAGRIAGGDEVVVVGCLPGLLFDLQVRTPLPEVCSNLVYFFGSEETRAVVGAHLERALRDPAVHFVIVETDHPVFGRTSTDMLDRWTPPLASLGYVRVPELEPGNGIEIHRR